MNRTLKIQGWDDCPSHKKEIDGFLLANYAPYTCKTMQEKGVCHFADSETCLLKKFKGGILVEPNPRRFAYGAMNRRNLSTKDGEYGKGIG